MESRPLIARVRRRRSFAAALIVALVTACGSATALAPTEFTVYVDSVTGPNAVSGGIANPQFLWGTVGAAGCTALADVRTTRAPSTMDVTVIGRRVPGADCLGDTVKLTGLPLSIAPIIPYDFMLVVHQPDGSTLVRRIYGE